MQQNNAKIDSSSKVSSYMRCTLPEAGKNIRSAVRELVLADVRAPEFEANSCCGIVKITSIPIRSALIGHSTQLRDWRICARWYAAAGEPSQKERTRSEHLTSWLEVVLLYHRLYMRTSASSDLKLLVNIAESTQFFRPTEPLLPIV